MTKMVACVPCNERKEEAKDALRNELEKVMKDVDPRRKICVVGDRMDRSRKE